MALESRTFDQIITFNRGTGATYVNANGDVVGVDFSTSTVSFGIGTVAFTLDATGNRGWTVGEAVIMVDQITGNSMIGTVGSYTQGSQLLVIEVSSSTGSGSSDDWRIGTLAARFWYDNTLSRRGIISEPTRTNILLNSAVLTTRTVTVVSGSRYTLSFYGTGSVTLSGAATGTFAGNGNPPNARTIVRIANTTTSSLTITVTGSVTMANLCQGRGGLLETWIPTTSVAITRAMDSIQCISTNSQNFLNQAGGTIEVEFYPARSGGDVVSLQVGTAAETNLQVKIPDITGLSGDTNLNEISTQNGYVFIGSTLKAGSNFIRKSVSDFERLNIPQTGDVFGFEYTPSTNTLAATGNTSTSLGGSVMTSTDNGDSWTARAINGNHTAVHYGRSRFFIGSSSLGELNISLGPNSRDFRRLNNAFSGDSVIRGIADDGSRVVLVGDNGNIWTSLNLTSWTKVNISDTDIIRQVAYIPFLNEARWIAVGDNGFLWTSANGTVWTKRTAFSPSQNMSNITHNGVDQVVIATGDHVDYSADGITWNTSTTNNFGFTVLGLAYRDGVYVAVGSTGGIRTSTDGDTWTSRTSGVSAQLNSVTGHEISGGGFVSIGNTGTIISSTNGTTWTTRTSGTTQNLNRVRTSPSQLMVVGNNNRVLYSQDVTNWYPATMDTAVINNITYGPGRTNPYVAVANTAGDGHSGVIGFDPEWRYRLYDLGQSAPRIGTDVHYSDFYGDYFVTTRSTTAASTDSIVKSSDGVTFTPLTTPAMNVYGIAGNGNGTLFAVGGSGLGATHVIARSLDGTTWNGVVNTAGNPTLNFIRYANGTFATCGTRANSPVVFYTTDEGLTWGDVTITSANATTLFSIDYDQVNGAWYAVGNGSQVFYSKDLENWTVLDQSIVIASTDNLDGVAYDVLGEYSGTGNTLNTAVIQYTSSSQTSSLNGGASSTVEGGIAISDRFMIGKNVNGVIKKLTYSN